MNTLVKVIFVGSLCVLAVAMVSLTSRLTVHTHKMQGVDLSIFLDESASPLTQENLIGDINIIRAHSLTTHASSTGPTPLSPLEDDEALNQEASELLQKFSSNPIIQPVASDGVIIDTFTKRTPGPQGSFFSSSALLKEWLHDETKASILTWPGTKIGSAALLTTSKDGVRTAIVAVIIR